MYPSRNEPTFVHSSSKIIFLGHAVIILNLRSRRHFNVCTCILLSTNLGKKIVADKSCKCLTQKL